MSDLSSITIYPLLFTGFALLSQVLLVLNFSARRWMPELERKWGWIVYALGVPSLGLSLWFFAAGQPWYHGLAYVLFTAWAAFGATVDIIRPVEWRSPIRASVFVPYLILYIATQFAFWIPLWFISTAYWFVYAVLYTLSTILNTASHIGKREKK